MALLDRREDGGYLVVHREWLSDTSGDGAEPTPIPSIRFWTLANNQEINKASPAISALAARTTNLGCVM
jgi:hypothetical protein